MRTSDRWICPVCGAPKDAKAKVCKDCWAKEHSKEIPDAMMVKRVMDLFHWNYSAAGRYFRVSDNAVRKWCKKYGIKKENTLIVRPPIHHSALRGKRAEQIILEVPEEKDYEQRQGDCLREGEA